MCKRISSKMLTAAEVKVANCGAVLRKNYFEVCTGGKYWCSVLI